MRIISLQLGHNATVAVAKAGEIVGVLSQEKCDNVKNSDAFPHDAISQLLKELKLTTKDIDRVVIASEQVFPSKAFSYKRTKNNKLVDASPLIRAAKFLERHFVGSIVPQLFELLKNRRLARILERGKAELNHELEKAGLGSLPLEHVEHHLCHARAAYHSAPKIFADNECLVLTVDGAGDGLSATVTKALPDGTFQRISSTAQNDSLGFIYSNTTRFLGMKELEHEYKVMGLAPYVKQEYMLQTYGEIFEGIAYFSSKDKMQIRTTVKASEFYEYLCENAVGIRFDSLAAALQHFTEELVVRWIENIVNETGIKILCMGGGLFMNVKLNKRIQELSFLDRVFFMPSCGDESNPIGACYDYFVRNGQPTAPLKNLYLGLSYENTEVEQLLCDKLDSDKYDFKYYDDIELEVATLLAARNAVARFRGKCEWGARSLGNRAILAHPSYIESFYEVNNFIKSRDFWMPFAPSIIEDKAEHYLENYDKQKVEALFMITAFDASSEGRDKLQAALHQGDHTLRPQVVKEQNNPEYYRILREFEKLTGVGSLLNTSFNLHGYPLVASPEQALFTLSNSQLKFLSIENFLITKK